MASSITSLPFKSDFGFLEKITHFAQEYNVPADLLDDALTLHLTEGHIILQQQADKVEARLEANSLDELSTLKSHLIESLTFFFPDMDIAYDWQGDLTSSKPLLNFRILKVTGFEDLTENMRRIYFQTDDLGPYDSPHFHVRLIIPPQPQAPELVQPDMIWPYLDSNGRLDQSDCPMDFAVRAYTIRDIDLAKNQLSIDFYLHETNGPGAQFAQNIQLNDCIGMTGPGGSAFQQADYYILSADETGHPAIARFCAQLPQDSQGEIHLAYTETDQEYSFDFPETMSLTHYPVSQQQRLVDLHANLSLTDKGAYYIWHASSQNQAKAIRKILRDQRQLPKESYHVAGYWRPSTD